MTYGFSRDDAGKFLNAYYDAKIFENDPFAKLDQTGVGKLMEMAIKLGKATRPDMHIGICGEHGGDPSSVEFCHKIGLTYVSCSPFRVPIARLAAAQAVIKDFCYWAIPNSKTIIEKMTLQEQSCRVFFVPKDSQIRHFDNRT